MELIIYTASFLMGFTFGSISSLAVLILIYSVINKYATTRK